MSLFSLYRQPFLRYRQILKIAIFGQGVDQCSRSCTYTLFLPKGADLNLFSLYGQRFPRYRQILKIAIFVHETWPLSIEVPEVVQSYTLYPRGSKLSLFSLYRQAFPRYGQIFKIAICGHEINLASGQISRSGTYTLFHNPGARN